MNRTHSHEDMYQAFQELMRYAPRTRIWLCQQSPEEMDPGCRSLILYGSPSPIGIIQPIVSPVTPEDESIVPVDTIGMISYEIENIGIFKEPVTVRCLTKVVTLLIQTRDEAMMSEDTVLLPRATAAIVAIRRLRTLFCDPGTRVPEATEALRAEAPRAFAYALSIVRQAVRYNALPEIMGMYTHTDLGEMYRFGTEVLGDLVADPSMVNGIEYAVPMVPAYRDDISHNLLRWVAFLCMEIRAAQSL